MISLDDIQLKRAEAAQAANAEDADVWRWFSSLVEERRVRWCFATDSWLVSVDNRHVATESSFDGAMRAAKENWNGRTASEQRRRREIRSTRAERKKARLSV
ncbi:hypothetical protein [Paraburkholderia fungorum]